MPIIRIIAVILGSAWFLPVSCTIGMIAGPGVISKIDAREVEKGEELHHQFKAVVGDGIAMGMYELESLIYQVNEVEDFTIDDNSYKGNLFLVPETSGGFETESSIYRYQVIEDTGDEQLIELREEYKDGDNTIWSRYRARRTSITPLSTKMYYFGYMFNAIPYVFGGTLSLFIIGRLLLFTFGAPPGPNENS
ncbi:hypothetical protein D3OALGA1CA_4718 [Olavius algarvensis associated proteobacterium Delta 3]|nr:hypothetical protein D3OALGB2SA_1992 [Olavius algarvensis associated proteobacterium Delta 3]CAB5155803.1 hypothetical protein D3OALGA1CA_4718 [Olavius algarvensis associated proteobacterium Delta 3]